MDFLPLAKRTKQALETAMKNLSKTFLTGLFAALPLIATIYLVYWFAVTTEAGLGKMTRAVLGPDLYIPGLGMAIAIIGIFLLGVLLQAYLFRAFLGWWEGLVLRIPVIRSIYGALKDLFGYMSKSKEGGFGEVVACKLFGDACESIGFVTRSTLDSPLSAEDADEPTIAVYVPLSYQIGGFTLLLPRSRVRKLEIGSEEAMRFVVTGGLAEIKPRAEKAAPEN
jgi:uncharacterized membrane protein